MADTEDRQADATSKPFQPAQGTGSGPEIDAMFRIATAVEYMAIQMGEMNRKLDRLIEASQKAPPPARP